MGDNRVIDEHLALEMSDLIKKILQILLSICSQDSLIINYIKDLWPRTPLFLVISGKGKEESANMHETLNSSSHFLARMSTCDQMNLR